MNTVETYRVNHFGVFTMLLLPDSHDDNYVFMEVRSFSLILKHLDLEVCELKPEFTRFRL